MFCIYCGREIDEKAVFCPHCGKRVGGEEAGTQAQPAPAELPAPEKKVKYCRNCGKEIDENAVICVHCGAATEPLTAKDERQKRVNAFGVAGFIVSLCSLFISILCIVPIVGLVLSMVGMNKRKDCNSANGLAMAGFVIGIISVSLRVLWLFLRIKGLV